MNAERSWTMPQRGAPVLAEADVVIVGGGYAGVCAAAAAARTGAHVALVERDGLIGGQAAEVYTFGLDAVIDNNGKQFIKGLPWEIITRTIAEGQSDPAWEMVDYARMEREGAEAEMQRLGGQYQFKSHQYLNPNALRHVMQTLLDEGNVAVSLGLFSVDDLLDLIDARPPDAELVITGRNAHPKVIERADLVTEMRKIKHYFDRGLPARRGIEF